MAKKQNPSTLAAQAIDTLIQEGLPTTLAHSTYTTSSLPNSKPLSIQDIKDAVKAINEADKKHREELKAWMKRPEYKEGLKLVKTIVKWLTLFDDRFDDLALAWTVQEAVTTMRPVHIGLIRRFEELVEEYKKWKLTH